MLEAMTANLRWKVLASFMVVEDVFDTYPIPECIDKGQRHYTGRRTCVVYATTTQDSSFLGFL